MLVEAKNAEFISEFNEITKIGVEDFLGEDVDSLLDVDLPETPLNAETHNPFEAMMNMWASNIADVGGPQSSTQPLTPEVQQVVQQVVEQALDANTLPQVDATREVMNGGEIANAALENIENGERALGVINDIQEGRQPDVKAPQEDAGPSPLRAAVAGAFSPTGMAVTAAIATVSPPLAAAAGLATTAWSMAQATFSDKAGAGGSEFARPASGKGLSSSYQASASAAAPAAAAPTQKVAEQDTRSFDPSRAELASMSLQSDDWKIGGKSLEECKISIEKMTVSAQTTLNTLGLMKDKGLAVDADAAREQLADGNTHDDSVTHRSGEIFRIEAVRGFGNMVA